MAEQFVMTDPRTEVGELLSFACTILGAKASGFRDSIKSLVSITFSSYSGLLRQS